jgi:hypothetical protein
LQLSQTSPVRAGPLAAKVQSAHFFASGHSQAAPISSAGPSLTRELRQVKGAEHVRPVLLWTPTWAWPAGQALTQALRLR